MAIKPLKNAREVTRGELRVGDKVYVVSHEPEVVENVMLDRNGMFETDEDYYDPSTVSILLAERVQPEIPTKKGSVVKVSADPHRSAHWFLRQDGKWYSQDTVVKTKEEFADFVENFDVEVIA